MPAKRVSFLTAPLGLQVLVDHTPVPTRTVADVPNCPNNETLPVVAAARFPGRCASAISISRPGPHIIGAVTPQMDNNGHWWVFNGWSNGQPQNAIYQVDNNPNSPATLTADYVQGARCRS